MSSAHPFRNEQQTTTTSTKTPSPPLPILRHPPPRSLLKSPRRSTRARVAHKTPFYPRPQPLQMAPALAPLRTRSRVILVLPLMVRPRRAIGTPSAEFASKLGAWQLDIFPSPHQCLFYANVSLTEHSCRSTGVDTLDEPVTATIVRPPRDVSSVIRLLQLYPCIGT